ncbi:MAG: ABC transporter substrate-binding protein [Verrucomicrobium sp.]|nr:ABC transporter substrate-binding protein [Verrucomicrobium sp.]
MLKSRWVIFGIPLSLALLTFWSALQSAKSQRLRGGNLVVASGEGVEPTLNPYLPMSEVDRQSATLVHAPLLRIGTDGRIEGALAKSWAWSQQTSLWFANEEYAQQASKKIRSLGAESWTRWHLASAEALGNELMLRFSDAGSAGGAAVLQAIAEFGPLPVETIRVEMNEPAWPHHEYFIQHALEKAQVKEVWFDGPKAYELRVSGETLRFFEELALYYQNLPALQAKMRIVAKNPMLERPLLEMPLRPGMKFHDGSPVTSADVERTIRLVLAQPWPVQGRDVLRMIHLWDSTDPTKVRISFRETYGPALTAFVGLPILPAKWIERQGNELAAVRKPFLTDPPSGAGPFKVGRLTSQQLFLQRVEGGQREGEPTGIEFRLDQNATNIRLGFAMKRVGLFWPDSSSLATMAQDPGVAVRSSTPRNRLQVVWNCRKAPLNDPRIRGILGQAVDRRALIQDFVGGQGQLCEGIFQPGLWYTPDLTPLAFDPLRGRQILYEMGWSKNPTGKVVKDGKVFKIELLTIAGSPERSRLAKRLAESWALLGIETTVVEVPWQELVGQRLQAHQFDAALIGMDFELAWDQWPYWHSSQALRGLNFSGVSDPALDSLLSTLRSEFEPARVPALAQAVEERIYELKPFLPLFAGGNPVAVRRDALPRFQREEAGLFQDLRQTMDTPALTAPAP